MPVDTDSLIEALARDVRPVPPYAVERCLGLGLTLGLAGSALIVGGVLGLRPDLGAAAGHGFFWAKTGYALSLGLAGLLLCRQLARPYTQRLRGGWLVLLPPAVLLPFALAELKGAAPGPASAGWTSFPLVLLLAAPVFLGLARALQRLAPTRFAAAGACAGLAAGGFGAALYSLHGQAESATYLLTRYTAAIALAAAAGALLGPRLMRW